MDFAPAADLTVQPRLAVSPRAQMRYSGIIETEHRMKSFKGRILQLQLVLAGGKLTTISGTRPPVRATDPSRSRSPNLALLRPGWRALWADQ
jgi:hypothetical protein